MDRFLFRKYYMNINEAKIETGQAVKPPDTPTQPKPETKFNAAQINFPINDIPVAPTNVMPPSEFAGFNKTGKSTSYLKTIIAFLGVLIFVIAAVFAYFRFFGKTTKILGGGGEIVWWGLNLDDDVVGPLINEYQQKNPKVKIKYIKQSNTDYRERLANSLTKGSGPDIFEFHNSWTQIFKENLDLVPASLMSSQDYANTYYPVIVTDMNIGEGFGGIPLSYDAITMYVNEDILASAGVTAPKTWDEVRDVGKKLTLRNDKNIIIQSGAAIGETDNVDHWPELVALMLLQNGANLNNPSSGNSKLAEDAISFYATFSQVDKDWDKTLPTSTNAFAEGKLAIYFAPAWRVDFIKNLNPKLNFKTYPLPQLRKDNPEAPDVGYATYWVEGVWSKGKNRDIAWDFMKFISSKESLIKLRAGMVKKGDVGGLIYPMIGMSDLLINDRYVGSVVSLAPLSKSWYLASDTYDGTTGINSQVAQQYKGMIKATNVVGRNASLAVKSFSPKIGQVLSQFMITPK